MKKIDLEATLAGIQVAMEQSAAVPGQDAAELACNRDGIDASLAFARWSYEQREKIEPDDLAGATGMLLGQMLIGSLGAFEDDDQHAAIHITLEMMMNQLERFLSGEDVEGDAVIAPVVRDVGDA